MKKEVFSKKEISEESISFVLLYSKPINRNKSLGPRCLIDSNGKTLLDCQLSSINSININKDIILCSGIGFEKIMRQNNKSYRILNNTFFEETGSVEEVKLAIANSYFDNFVFISDNYLSTKKDLIELSKSSKIVVSKKNCSDTKLIVNGNIAKQINYTNGKHHLTGTFSLSGKELELAKKYILGKEYNKTKLYTEMLNYIIENNGKFTILEKV